jgi:Spy/CpxP family protein refolding chaperone
MTKVKLMIAMTMLAVSTSLWAAGDESPEKMRGGWLKKELNLTDEQMKKVGEIRRKHRDDIKASRKLVKESRKNLGNAVQIGIKGSEYQATLTEYFKKLQDAENDQREKMFKMALEIREVLEPNQIAKFHAMKSEFKGKIKDRIKGRLQGESD